MSFELITVSLDKITQAQTAEVIALCSDVFRMDYAFYMNLGLYRVHVLGYEDGLLVSHALWLERQLRIGDGPWRNAAYVEGVATHADTRRRGYGSAVMRRLQREIAGYDLARCRHHAPSGTSGSAGSGGRGRCSSSRMGRRR